MSVEEILKYFDDYPEDEILELIENVKKEM